MSTDELAEHCHVLTLLQMLLSVNSLMVNLLFTTVLFKGWSDATSKECKLVQEWAKYCWRIIPECAHISPNRRKKITSFSPRRMNCFSLLNLIWLMVPRVVWICSYLHLSYWDLLTVIKNREQLQHQRAKYWCHVNMRRRNAPTVASHYHDLLASKDCKILYS